MNVDALVDGLIDGNYDFEFYLMLFNIKQVLTDEKEQMLLFLFYTYYYCLYYISCIYLQYKSIYKKYSIKV